MRWKVFVLVLVLATAAVPAALAEEPPVGSEPAAAEQRLAEAKQRLEEAKQQLAEAKAKLKEQAKARAEQERSRARAAKKERAEARAAERAKLRKAKRKARCGNVLAMGEVLEAGEEGFLLDVQRSNLKRLRGAEVRFLVGERTKLRGADEPAGLAGWRVVVHAKACKVGDAVKLEAVKVHATEPPADDLLDEEEPAGEPSEDVDEESEETEEVAVEDASADADE